MSFISEITLTLPECLFFYVVSHIFTAFYLRTIKMDFDEYAFRLNFLYFIACCFWVGSKLGWNMSKHMHND